MTGPPADDGGPPHPGAADVPANDPVPTGGAGDSPAPDRDTLSDEAAHAAQEDALLARLQAAKARVELLAGLVSFSEARWPMLAQEERRRDPCAPDETIAGRVRERLEIELRARGLDD